MLLLSKYDYFLKQPEQHYPRVFDKARSSSLTGERLVTNLYAHISKAPEADRDEVFAEYITCLYNIDVAIIAHLELRKAWRELTYRDECSSLADAYSERLRNLYTNEVKFGRSEVHRFVSRDDIVMLINATEADAIDYIDSILTDAMWYQLNGSHGWFDEEAESAEQRAEVKTRILNKAMQRKWPLKRKQYRPTKRV
jgi:hypothetical protein